MKRIRSVSKLAHNEKIKLRATFTNNIAVGLFVGIMIALGQVGLSFPVYMGAMVGALLCSVLIHIVAETMLNQIRDS
jgi:hypothetical protein